MLNSLLLPVASCSGNPTPRKKRGRGEGSDGESDAPRKPIEPVRRSSRAAAQEKKSYIFDSDVSEDDDDKIVSDKGKGMPEQQVRGQRVCVGRLEYCIFIVVVEGRGLWSLCVWPGGCAWLRRSTKYWAVGTATTGGGRTSSQRVNRTLTVSRVPYAAFAVMVREGYRRLDTASGSSTPFSANTDLEFLWLWCRPQTMTSQIWTRSAGTSGI